MLKGEAINYGKKLRADIGNQTESTLFMADAEQLKQFLDVAIWEMEKEQKNEQGKI